MYAHSSELEEIGIISLNGVSVENDSHKESLIGVRNLTSALIPSNLFCTTEAILVLLVHLIKLTCTRRSQSQGAAVLDVKSGSHSFTGFLKFIYYLISVILTDLTILSLVQQLVYPGIFSKHRTYRPVTNDTAGNLVSYIYLYVHYVVQISNRWFQRSNVKYHNSQALRVLICTNNDMSLFSEAVFSRNVPDSRSVIYSAKVY